MHIKYIVSPFLLMGTLLACSPAKAKQSSSLSSDYIDIVNKHKIKWDSLFQMEEDNYLVYVYAETCANCQMIKQEVFDFVIDEIVPFYFVDLNDEDNNIVIGDNIESSYGATKIDEVIVMGTPTIIEINLGYLTCNVGGKENCLKLLNEKRLLVSFF